MSRQQLSPRFYQLVVFLSEDTEKSLFNEVTKFSFNMCTAIIFTMSKIIKSTLFSINFDAMLISG